MIQTKFASSSKSQPLANFRVFESEDCAESAAHFCSTMAPSRLFSSEPSMFRSEHSRTRFGNEWINVIGYESQIEMAAVVPPDTYILSLVLDGACAFQSEHGETKVARMGDMVIVNPDEQFSIKTYGNYSNLVFQIDRDSLDKTFATEMGGPLPGKLVFESGCVSQASLARFMLLCCAELDDGVVDARWDAVGKSYARTFHSLLLDGLNHNLSGWMKRGSLSTAAPYYVRTAEEFIRSNSAEPLTLHEIAEAANISARSLHNGFRRFRGQTPMGYLKMVRLERVHQELRACRNRDRTITQIAFEQGFNHMSKFGYDYRLRFGELPSRTLHHEGA